MLLCDLRDLEGDRVAGTISLPVYLGTELTWRVLLLVGSAVPLLAFLLSWPWQAFASLGYLAGLILALRRPRSESFYEWWVEGLLFLPALVEAARAGAGFLTR
jgi:1,4-dihydroxy-2-naphthoate octaprenyltransferase